MPRARQEIEVDAARARAIVAALSAGTASSEEVFAAFAELDALEAETVRDALGSWIGPAPDPDLLDDATRAAHGLPCRPLRLRTLEVVRDADVLDLGPVAEEQLRLAGKSWDGVDLPPEERLDGEVEGSFAGTLERRVVADAERPGTPLYDVLLYADGAGVVFHAGTTEIVAFVADGAVETRDRRARTALQEALAEPASSLPSAAPKTEPLLAATTNGTPATTAPAKKAPAKKAPAEKAPAEKAASTKMAAKKAAAKKTAAKKTAAKKTAAKKTAAKKTAAKKTAAKKTAAKKTAAKTSTPAKKTSTKKKS